MRKIIVEVRSWESADKVVCGLLTLTTLYLLAHIAAALILR